IANNERTGYLITGLQHFQIRVLLDFELHRHRRHVALDVLVRDCRRTILLINGDDFALDIVMLLVCGLPRPTRDENDCCNYNCEEQASRSNGYGWRLHVELIRIEDRRWLG